MENLNLNEKSIIYYLKQYKVRKQLKFYPETNSTNDVAKQLCREGKGKGVLVAVDFQLAGKGRQGRSFYSPKGKGIYFSAVYELNQNNKNLELISSAAGLAVGDTLYNIFNLDAKIKWPNDIFVDGKKICGILCEVVNEGNTPKYVVVGIGLNVEKTEFPAELEYIATSIGNVYSGGVELDHNEILVDIVNNLDRYIIRSGLITGGDCSEIVSRLKAHSSIIGEMVRVHTNDAEYDAKVLDIDENGGLVVKGPMDIHTITSGEVQRIV